MDKRILKTKKNLKDTLREMLGKMTFDEITVKKICDESSTSRVTFYTHYKDKYDLMDDVAHDMIKMAQKEYIKLQEQNNSQKDAISSYCNFLECILNMYCKNLEFFSHTTPHENPYLNFSFHKYIFKYLEIHTQKRSATLKPKYSVKQVAGFLCYGLWGFINESLAERRPMEQIKIEAIAILKKILRSEVLTENY